MLQIPSNYFASSSPLLRRTYEESKKVARQGGHVAKVALKELESKTGKKVVSPLNAKTLLGIEKPKKKKEE